MIRTGAFLSMALLLSLAAISISQHDAKPVTATGGVVAIAAGNGHTCAVLADGGVQCWGTNDNGQLGDGTENSSHLPVDVCSSGSGVGCSGGERLTGIVDVTAGFAHTCALTQLAGVKCWGANSSGQLGDGTEVDRAVPSDVCETGTGPDCSGGERLSGVLQVDAGSGHTCAVMEDTGIKCWGSDQLGQLGIGTFNPMAGASPAGGFGGEEWNPVDVCEPGFIPFGLEAAGIVIINPCLRVTGFTAVSAGGEFTCALTEETGAKCWGAGSYGRLGNNADETITSPVDVCRPIVFIPMAGISCIPASGFEAIDAGGQHTCALTDDARVECWGRNIGGVLGDGTKEDRFTPVAVCASGSGCGSDSALAGISHIATGDNYSCAIAAGGDARCWGGNFRGVVGDGTTDQRDNPTAVSGLSADVTLLQGGARATHACAATNDGQLSCWGNNFNGQLATGPGDNDAHPLPVTVPGFEAKPTATPTNTPLPGATSTPTPLPGGLIGDVDCSGLVNAIDAAFVLQFVAGLIVELPCPENGDTNEDGQINTIDATLILQFSAGFLGMLPP